MKGKFIFVVCGGAEHIRTLNYALGFLRRFSQREILVLTDTSRNECDIEHDDIIDIKTPLQYNHHQASIYLKTGIHQFVELGEEPHCYLDTDILALDEGCDGVFRQYQSPITFCTDHCRMRQFSPTAVLDFETNARNLWLRKQLDETLSHFASQKDGKQYDHPRLEAWEKANAEWEAYYTGDKLRMENKLNESIQEFESRRSRFLEQMRHHDYTHMLRDRLDVLERRKNHWSSLILKGGLLRIPRKGMRFLTKQNIKSQFRKAERYFKRKGLAIDSYPDFVSFMKGEGFVWNGLQQSWSDLNGQRLFDPEFEFKLFWEKRGFVYSEEYKYWLDTATQEIVKDAGYVIRNTQKETGLVWDSRMAAWKDADGLVLKAHMSDGLQKAIKDDLGVDVKEPNFQHWNGGVFLFNQDSVPFLDQWHQWTLAAFDLPNWLTRDQGTLIATVWKLGLEKHKTLPLSYNFLADYYHPTMRYKGDLTFRLDNAREDIRPHLIHIYHHFGDKEWKLWQDVEKHLGLEWKEMEAPPAPSEK